MSIFSRFAALKGGVSSKLAFGFVGLAAAAVIAASGLANAAPEGKPTKEECQTAGFKNYGQCVKEWAHNKNHPGHGYGYGSHHDDEDDQDDHGHGHGHGHHDENDQGENENDD